MCGIAGLLYRSGRTVEQTRLDCMTDAMIHRGPDDRGTWIEHSIGLGHRRLAIRDLSPAGHQPFADESEQIFVTYNGEIYNDADLRRTLAREHGVRFRTTCDTELLPAGYRVWGDKLFERLEGIFALGLWDRRSKRLVLARDAIGVKPLFYSDDRDVVRFASEIKGILADGEFRTRVSAAGLHRFLAMGYPGPAGTMLEGIVQVPPGTIMTFDAGGTSSRIYWKPRRAAVIRSMNEAIEEFVPLWSRVVGEQLISDVPVGVMQSGGIDSALVSVAAGSVRKVPAFTAAFSDEGFDETERAGQLARAIETTLTTVDIDVGNGFADALPKVIRHYDGQVCDEASVPLFLLSAEMRKHITVAMSGDGGDEFFAGYPTYRASRIAAVAGAAVPGSLWRSIARMFYGLSGGSVQHLPPSALIARFAAGTAASAANAHPYWRRLLPEFLMPSVYGPALAPLLESDPFLDYARAGEGADGSLIDACLLADQQYHLPGGLLLKTDAMSMAHGLEVRVPFLDRRIMDFAGRCAPGLLAPLTGESKPVLRSVARRMGVPSAVADARKRGFNTPLGALLRGQLAPLVDDLLEGSLLEPYIRPEAVRSLWQEHCGRAANHAYALWPILNFALWRRAVGSNVVQ